jgi:hypothetical protein
MLRNEEIQFVLTFKYDTMNREHFESIWNLGFKMLKMVDDYSEGCDHPIDVRVNESPGALMDRKIESTLLS